jgi:hypothetical protein
MNAKGGGNQQQEQQPLHCRCGTTSSRDLGSQQAQICTALSWPRMTS